MSYAKLNNSLSLPVIDRFGYLLDVRELKNTAAAELWPKEPVVQIQWTADNQRPTVEELMQTIEYNGKTYHGHFAWGSAVKRGQTIGLTRDFPHEEGPVTMVEDGQRVGRYLYAAGIFGGFKGDITVGIEKPHALLPCGPVEDGFGYIRRRGAEKFASKQRVSLGTSRDNWTYWQRLPWEKIKDEMTPVILEAATDASDPSKMLWAASHSFEQKQELVKLDMGMIEHPFVAAALNRSSQSYFARLCSSVHLGGQYRIAVPTTAETVCWPDHHGKIALDRSPIDSNGSIQAVEVEPYPAEEERIGNLEVIQVTIASKQFMSKGCLGIVDDDLLEYDVVICSEDIKMVSSDIGRLGDVRKLSELVVRNAVVPFLMVWDAQSIVGVNAEWAKDRMGLDHDGDAVRLVDCAEYPMLWQTIKDLPEGETPKLPKSKRLIAIKDQRPEMIYKSMVNLVGQATNVAGSTFMLADRSLLASQLGYKSVNALDNRLNYFIKVGTDGFKTDVDQAAVAKEIAIVQDSIQKLFGHGATWTRWDGDQIAFCRDIPRVILAVVKPDQTDLVYFDIDNQPVSRKVAPAKVARYIVYGQDEPIVLDERQLKIAIWPLQDGTVAQIARIAIPFIQPNWLESVPIRPLTGFRKWAPEVPELAEAAEQAQFWFNARVTRVNWTDPKDVAQFKADWNERLDQWKGDTWEKACALWHVAHSSRGKDATAASVFLGFPEECTKIIAEKPGDKVKEIMLTGLSYQLPRFVRGELKDIQVVDVVTIKGGKKIIRRCVVGDVAGQVAPKDATMPRNLIAFVAANTDQPECGQYKKIVVQPFGNSSWKAQLV